MCAFPQTKFKVSNGLGFTTPTAHDHSSRSVWPDLDPKSVTLEAARLRPSVNETLMRHLARVPHLSIGFWPPPGVGQLMVV